MDRQTESAHGESAPPGTGEPLTVFPFPPAAAARPTADTVINPERRGSSSLPAAGPGAVATSESSLWPRLFPPDIGGDEDSLEGPAGARLDHFVIEERIGVGGMGAVFRAFDQRLQRVVALKVLSPAMSRDGGAVQRFQNEARAAARLDHDNIARVHYIGEDRGLHFIAFEYVTGTNLRDLIQRQGRLPAAETVNYALQIATALVHTSAAGVVHRDIKPSNIIVTPSGRAKLVDLGLARKQNSESVGDLTMAGTTLGTFDYISPEQAKDPRNVDVRSDIYSLGCTMYQMLAGEPPYAEGTVLQKLLDHQGKEPPDAAAKNPLVPAELSGVIRRMMASDPRRRFSSAEDLLRHLLPIAAAMGLRGLHPEGLVWVKPPSLRLRFWERHLGWMATAAVLVALVLLVDRWPRDSGAGDTGSANGNAAVGAAANGTERSEVDRIGEQERTTSRVEPASRGSGSQAGDSNVSDRTTNSQPADEIDNGDVERGVAEGAGPSTAKLTDGAGRPLSGNGDPPDSLRSPIDGSGLLVNSSPSSQPDALEAATPESPKPNATAGSGEPRAPSEAGSNPPAASADPATADAPKPSPAAPPTAAAAPQRPFFVISDGKETARPTLEAACTDARTGSTIELRYDGRLAGVVEKPFRIANKSLTIRAGTKPATGEKYRPLVEFAADPLGDPQQTRMISLLEASVELINVDLAMTVDSNVRLAEDQCWSLISLAGNETIALQGSTVTVLNPGDQPAAVFEVAAGTASDASGMMKMMATMGSSASRKFSIDVTRSIVRGSCDMLVSRQGRPGRLETSQSLVAVAGSLLRATGTVDASDKTRELELDLSHLTCIIGHSLLRLDSGSLPRQQLPVNVSSAANNIIAAAAPGLPLVSMAGNTPADEFRRLLRWNGARNFYDGFAWFWSIESGQDFVVADPDDFDDWKRAWSSRGDSTGEVDAVNGGVLWTRAWRATDLAKLTPADVALADSAGDNPALGAASNGEDVGADLSRLPPVPRASDSPVP